MGLRHKVFIKLVTKHKKLNYKKFFTNKEKTQKYFKSLKRSYTKRVRKSVKGGLETLDLIIGDYSNSNISFETLGHYTEKLHERAKTLKSDSFRKSKVHK